MQMEREEFTVGLGVEGKNQGGLPGGRGASRACKRETEEIGMGGLLGQGFSACPR